jgi:hypothetical protein
MKNLENLTIHHIIPKSRGGRRIADNAVIVQKKKHRLYHKLFANLLPEEVVQHLNQFYWGEGYYIKIEQKINSHPKHLPVSIGKKEEAYFKMFGTMEPTAILEYLGKELWGNKYDIDIEEKENILFGSTRYS